MQARRFGIRAPLYAPPVLRRPAEIKAAQKKFLKDYKFERSADGASVWLDFKRMLRDNFWHARNEKNLKELLPANAFLVAYLDDIYIARDQWDVGRAIAFSRRSFAEGLCH